MESEYISQLKMHIERTLGRRILSSTDCRYLHNDISQQLQSTLSFNTLRRFFNLMEAKHEQSIYTLNLLSAYCGFSSFDDFISSIKENPIENNNTQNSDLLNYLVMFFKKPEINNTNDFTYSYLVQQTIIFLEQHPHLIDPFQREIAKTKNGQDFYFEQCINTDCLNSFYGDGLRYYLHAKKTMDAQLFGNYLLCFRFWLTRNNKNLEKHYEAIIQYEGEKKAQPSIAGFFYASQIYYANAFGINQEAILVKVRDYYTHITPLKENYASIFKFHITLSQALLLTAQYEEALFYISEVLKNKKKYATSSVDLVFLETIYLFKAIALAHLGEKATAKELLDLVDPNNFYFLSRQYMNILFLSLRLFLKKTASEQKQLQYLVKTTGFIRLLEW